MRQSARHAGEDVTMRMTRVFVDAPLEPGVQLDLPEEAAAHLVRVLRARTGDACTLFAGDGREFAAGIVEIRGARVRVLVGAAHEVDRESPLPVTLLQGMARSDRMDLIVQKATELGVTRIVPVLCQHSVVRLDAHQTRAKTEHWRAVAISACEQCGRNRLPASATPGTAPLPPEPRACCSIPRRRATPRRSGRRSHPTPSRSPSARRGDS